jgi:hypothetical protein
MVRRQLPPSEAPLAEWLTEATDNDLLILTGLLRQEIADRIQEADSRGDGAYVNAWCAAARKWFTRSLVW